MNDLLGTFHGLSEIAQQGAFHGGSVAAAEGSNTHCCFQMTQQGLGTLYRRAPTPQHPSATPAHLMTVSVLARNVHRYVVGWLDPALIYLLGTSLHSQ